MRAHGGVDLFKVMSSIAAIPLTFGLLIVPFNYVLLVLIYAILGYNMLSGEMAENLRM